MTGEFPIPHVQVRSTTLYTHRRTLLRLEGAEALDFLNRLSTNQLADLGAGGTRTTVFTNEKGRIVQVADVHRRPTDILVIGAAGDGSRLEHWLRRYLIMEDIRIENLTGKFLALDEIVETGATVQPGLAELEYYPDLWSHRLRRAILESGAETLNAGTARAPEMHREQMQAGGQPKREREEISQLDRFRIIHGIPGEETELTSDYNPLEARLERFVSFTKGCYIGQEVIARIDSYKKLQRILFKLLVLIDDSSDHLPSAILASGAAAGRITSWIPGTAHGTLDALGYIELKHEAAALTVSCECGKQHSLQLTPHGI